MNAGIRTSEGVSAQAGVLNTGMDVDITLSINSGFNFTHSGMENSITL